MSAEDREDNVTLCTMKRTLLAVVLASGAFTMIPAGGATQSIAISWLQEGVPVYPYVFSCPNEAGKPSGFEIASETLAAGSGLHP